MTENSAVSRRAEYQAPTLAVLGTFEQLTQGTSNGNFLDNTFPDGTPRGELTFS